MKIQITDKYAIHSDTYSWTIHEKKNNKKLEKGYGWYPLFYYSSIEGAVNGLYKLMLRRSEATTLSEALLDGEKAIQALTDGLRHKFKVEVVGDTDE